MQPKPVPPPPTQPTLPFEILPRTGLPQQTEPWTEEAAEDLCWPEETWQTLDPQGRDQLREAWVRVLKEVVDDVQDR